MYREHIQAFWRLVKFWGLYILRPLSYRFSAHCQSKVSAGLFEESVVRLECRDAMGRCWFGLEYTEE